MTSYDVLAPHYERLGLADFALNSAPRIFDYALRHGWMGRRVADLGCGAGHSALWLIKHGYLLTCVDHSAAMLAQARQTLNELSYTAQQQDVRSLQGLSELDMSFAFGLMNELDSIKDLEAVFQRVHAALRAEKWFIFDLLTIEGLFQRHQQASTQLLVDDDNLNILSVSQFDYDRQLQSLRYIIYAQQGSHWQREATTLMLRAYPLAAVTALLQRTGFQVLHVLRPSLERYEPNQGGARAVIIAQKR